jgi:hypothetical protein
MTLWWKLAIVLTLLTFQDAVVWRVKGKFDTAAQEEVLQAQIAATAKKQAEIETVAKAAETELLTERQKSAMLGKTLGTIRATKTHHDCKLDAATVGLLRDATRPGHTAR